MFEESNTVRTYFINVGHVFTGFIRNVKSNYLFYYHMCEFKLPALTLFTARKQMEVIALSNTPLKINKLVDAKISDIAPRYR